MRRIPRLIVVALAVAAAAVGVAAAALAATPRTSDTHLSYVGSTDAPQASYGRGDYVCDTVEFSGSALSGASVLSVGDMERLAVDEDSGIGYEGTYSLLTSGSVFSRQSFSGLKLYDLLVRLGLDTSAAGSTPVRVYAADGYSVTLTLAAVRESSRYDCYAAKGDPTVTDAGVPVLLSFAVDSVPLIGPTGDDAVSKVFTADEGYDVTADNVGGPIRLTIGQTAVDDFNARYNAKWVTKVVVGDATEPVHTGDYASLATSRLAVDVYDSADTTTPLETASYSVADIEALASSKMAGGYYEDDGAGGFYHGVDLWKLVKPLVGLPAYEGTVTFTTRSGGTATVDLAYLRNLGGDYSAYTVTRTATLLDGSAATLAVTGVRPLLAFAKNGYPLVTAAGDTGYLTTGVAGAMVDNQGGPLAVLLPRDGEHLAEPVYLADVTGITLTLDIPTDVHAGDTYGYLGDREIAFRGNGLDEASTLTVAGLEGKVEYMVTQEYGAAPYHGIDLLQLLEGSDLGVVVDAGYVTVTGADGSCASFSMADLEDADTPVLLAFSRDGVPLVEGSTSAGYVAAAGNDGGPIKLVSGSQTVDDVVAVAVTRKYGIWTHDRSPYSACLPVSLTISGSEADGTTILSVRDLESLDHVRDSFAASKGESAYQGVVLRDLVKAHLAAGVSTPTKITVYGADGYSARLGVDAVLKGIDSTYQPGEHRDVILAYGKNGYPLVATSSSDGYVATAYNDDGPLHLIVENSVSSWVKDVRAVVIGDGEPVYAADRVWSTAVRIDAPTVLQTGGYAAVGSGLGLKATVTPADSTDTVGWSSSDTSVATVTAAGGVKAVGRGTATITVATSSGRADAYVLHVTRRLDATAIALPSAKAVTVGRAVRLRPTVTPSTATSLLTWRSSDRGIASVDGAGRVTGRRRGTVTIMVRTSSGRRAVCRVTVRPAP